MCALRGNGEMLVLELPPFHWGLNAAEKGFDASRGEIEMRKLNIAEVKFPRSTLRG